ncbi:MAG: TolC family protein [endosymbiont of Galathealinum brachiosum]|uniref:TolC family protein n=1 Tax=endosymbiont of Galathealinum brachiosum TaxID=2200906 RepID=A0A370DI56_9GAMM|nr:MAG: TolC family protein [endosymbiont of Galathealinum brachiosum]
MLSRSANILFSCTLLFFNTALQADSGLKSHEHKNANTHSINLHDAINKTFEHNPTLHAFNYALKAQTGRQLEASLAPGTNVSFDIEDALGSGDFKGTDNAQATLSIAWVLEGKIRQGYIDVARAGTSSLSTQTKIKRLDAAAETARLYIISLANQARLNNAVKTLNLAKETVAAVKKRVTAGKTPEAELARARAEFARRQLGYEDIEHELSSAIRLLAAQWGETYPVFTQVEGNIFTLPAIMPFETLKTQIKQSPDLTRLMSDKRLKQAQLKLAESQSNSEWRVNLGIRHYETTNDQALVAGISIPFGERSRNKGRIIEARENLSQTLAEADALKVHIETTLYVLSEELQHSLHQVDTYSKDIIPQLEKALKETQRAYNLGRYSYLEWSSVQAELLDARSALVEASIDAHLKVIEIERLTGMPMAQLKMQPVNKS